MTAIHGRSSSPNERLRRNVLPNLDPSRRYFILVLGHVRWSMDVMFNTWHTEPRRRWQTDKTGYPRSQAKSKKAEAFGRKHNVDSCNSVSYKALAALDLLLITYARIQLPLYTASYRLALLSAIALADDLLSHSTDVLGYGSPPPTYDDAINDLPPEYSTLPEQAEAKPSSPSSCFSSSCRCWS